MNKSKSRMKSNIIPYNSNNIAFSSSISYKKNNSNNKHSFDIWKDFIKKVLHIKN